MTFKEWAKSGNFVKLPIGVDLSTPEQKTIFWKAIDRNREVWTEKVSPLVEARFNSERRAVLKVLRSDGVDSALIEVLNGGKEWFTLLLKIYLAVGEFFGRMTLEQGFKSSPGTIDKKEALPKEVVDVMNDRILAWISQEAGKKISKITATTRKQIREALAEGVAEGESIPKLSARLDELYLKEIIPNRSTVIARTEVISASNLGNRAGALASALPLDHEWIATPDSRTRDAHAEVDGQKQALETPYSVAGERLMFPGDTSLGASASNTIMCRCTEGFIVRKKGKP